MVTSSVSPERAETMPAIAVPRAPRRQRRPGLGQRAALVGLEQHGVARRRSRAAARTRAGVGDQEVVADDLHAVARGRG